MGPEILSTFYLVSIDDVNLAMGIKDFFTYLLSWSSDLSGPHKLGYRARTFNNDLILSKTFKAYSVTVDVYQGFEPYNPVFKELVDFTIPDACVVISPITNLPSSLDLASELRTHFESVIVRGEYLFAFSRFLELEDLKIKSVLDLLEERLR